ncbi:Hypothetical predicted protein [Xyrichtys novacula]|uniref:Uncharacterized protein n=1 Tax=Xyrichtys novacula TaxID=13765 RepID=A0AAV1H7P2_XYRNO|nr:Hypothetical predicted protein [Xyrichtys novacula]
MAKAKQKHQQNMTNAGQIVDSLQHELQNLSQAPFGQTSRDQFVIMSLKTEHKTIYQKMREEMVVLQHYATQKEQMLMTELEKLKNQLNVQKNFRTELQATNDENLGQLRAMILEEKNLKDINQLTGSSLRSTSLKS